MPLVLLEKPLDHVALLRMNRPDAMNALNTAVREELCAHFEALTADDDVRVIVVTGNEEVFIAGADLKEMADKNTADWAFADARRMWRIIGACPKPIISAVTGFALGGGCELALSTDIIVAGEGAQFGQPEIRVGILPGGGGTQRLVRAIGKYRAMKLLLTAEFVSAQDALEMGFVSEVVPDAEVLDRALELAKKITRMPPLSVKLTKEVVNAGLDGSLETGLLLERKAFEILFATEDQKEGMRAFIEKRRPEFKGK
ncbi:MAG: enoyl-CoA hydratase-related protein [Magnetovibrio sp.]|nr:enoyl-CoA hydratase-related protein [Magnetovibrio sp.]